MLLSQDTARATTRLRLPTSTNDATITQNLHHFLPYSLLYHCSRIHTPIPIVTKAQSVPVPSASRTPDPLSFVGSSYALKMDNATAQPVPGELTSTITAEEGAADVPAIVPPSDPSEGTFTGLLYCLQCPSHQTRRIFLCGTG